MWQETARQQHGVITRRQLDALGLTDAQIDALRVRGDIVVDPRRRGLWRSGSAPVTPLTQAWAAVLATDAVLSHRSAAAVHGFAPAPASWVHVTVDDRTHIRGPSAVRVHRIPLDRDDVVSIDGLPVTAGPRTIIECLRFEPLRDGRHLVDRALQQGWVSLDDLDRELRDFPGRWGTRKLRRLRIECAMGDAVSERKLHRVLSSAGIAGWEANAPVDVGYAVLTFDVVFRSLKLIIEVDGWWTHTKLDRFQTDRTRQNSVVGLGWQVLRFTWFDIVERPAYVVASVRRAMAQRS